jgi:hypothetical protein
MGDVQFQGEDREPSPWPPRLLVIAILVLLAFAVVRHLPTQRAAHPHSPAATVSAGPVQLAGLGSRAAGLLNYAAGIGGPPAARSRAWSRSGTTRRRGPAGCTQACPARRARRGTGLADKSFTTPGSPHCGSPTSAEMTASSGTPTPHGNSQHQHVHVEHDRHLWWAGHAHCPGVPPLYARRISASSDS